jgi:hypothetical protein
MGNDGLGPPSRKPAETRGDKSGQPKERELKRNQPATCGKETPQHHTERPARAEPTNRSSTDPTPLRNCSEEALHAEVLLGAKHFMVVSTLLVQGRKKGASKLALLPVSSFGGFPPPCRKGKVGGFSTLQKMDLTRPRRPAARIPRVDLLQRNRILLLSFRTSRSKYSVSWSQRRSKIQLPSIGRPS